MIHKKTTEELKKDRPKPAHMASLPRTPISLIVDNIRSLDNVGLIFRMADLARLEKIFLTGYTGHPRIENDVRPSQLIARHEHRITKTAVYAVPHQPWEYHEDTIVLVKELKQKGTRILALEQTNKSQTYHAVNYQLPLALIVGHERQGVRPELLELADDIIEIPILGVGNSHNVAIATSIVVYHILEKTGQFS